MTVYRAVIVVAGLVLISLAVGGYQHWQRSDQQVAAQSDYEVETVGFGNLSQTVAANGTLNPVVLVNVGTQVSGTVKKLYTDFNDRVEQGQVLLELDPALFQAQVKQSEAGVRNAEARLDLVRANAARLQRVFQRGFVSQQDLDQATQELKLAQAQRVLAQAQLEKDRINLSYTVIRSPVSGVVIDRSVDIGQTVAASFQTPTLFKIAQDLRQMQIYSNFAEADIGVIQVRQTAYFTVDAFPERIFPGVVKQIRLNPTVQQNVVTYNVVISVDNPEQWLLPGMTAYVNIVVAERKNVLLVTNAALRFKPRETAPGIKPLQSGDRARAGATGTVYLLRENSLKPITLTTGITNNRFTEVLAGELQAGDQVVVAERRPNGGPFSSGSFHFRLF